MSASRRQFLTAAASLAAGAGLAIRSHAETATRIRSVANVPSGSASSLHMPRPDVPTILRVCRNVASARSSWADDHRHGVEPTRSARAAPGRPQAVHDAGIDIWGLGSVCGSTQQSPRVSSETSNRAAVRPPRGRSRRPRVKAGRTAFRVAYRSKRRSNRSAGPCASAVRRGRCRRRDLVEVHGPGTSEPRHCRTIMEQANHRAAV